MILRSRSAGFSCKAKCQISVRRGGTRKKWLCHSNKSLWHWQFRFVHVDYNRICWNNTHFFSPSLFSCHNYSSFSQCNHIKKANKNCNFEKDFLFFLVWSVRSVIGAILLLPTSTRLLQPNFWIIWRWNKINLKLFLCLLLYFLLNIAKKSE